MSVGAPTKQVWCPPCCASGSSESGSEDSGQQGCCADVLSPCTQLTVTIESPCAAINGRTFTIDNVTPGGACTESSERAWANGGPAGNTVNINNCLLITPRLECGGVTGCMDYVFTANSPTGPGCLITPFQSTPTSCSCTPFELFFSGATITEDMLFPGSCVCCALGAPVNFRITR